MPIKVTCPHCAKQFKAKDDLAGKKVNCPGCKKIVGVPEPSSHVHPALRVGSKVTQQAKASDTPDLEALAAEAVTDQSAAAEPSSQTINFTCVYCDAELKLPAELSGKQTPCPECRRIVKVPLLEKTGPRDWRAPDKQVGPSGALRKDLPPDDSWSTAQAAKVSTQALVEAGVLQVPKVKLTAGQWAARVSYAVMAAVLLSGIAWGVVRWLRGSFEAVSLGTIDAYVAGKTDEKPTLEARFELACQMAQYAWLYEQKAKQPLEANVDGKRSQRLGKAEFVRSRQLAEELRDPALRYMAALSLLEMARTIPLEERDLGSVLRVATSGLPRECILRKFVAERLSPKANDEPGLKQEVDSLARLMMQALPPVASGVGVMDVSDQLAALGVLGQEVLALGKRSLALGLLKSHLGRISDKFPPPLPLLALAHQLGENFPKETAPDVRDAARLYGFAQAGQIEAASRLLEEKFKTPTKNHLGFHLAVAAGALAKKPADTGRAEAQKVLNSCREWMGPERLPDAHWERFRWCELMLEAAGPDAVGVIDQQLLSGAALGRFRAYVFKRRIDHDLATVTVDQARLLEPPGIGRQLALSSLARAQARAGNAQVRQWVRDLEQPGEQAFALMGLLLGELEAK